MAIDPPIWAPDNARLIAAQAKSLRAELMRQPGAPPATTRDLADVVELIELLATEVADVLASNLQKGD